MRNITAISIADDVFLSDQEAYRVADALCLNIIDDDLNGKPDRVIIDSDEDKKPDAVGFDYDQDGEWDHYKKIA